MTTDTADRNDALSPIRQNPTVEWLHKECGHFQKVPASGGIVTCDNCGITVDLAPKEKKLPKSNSKKLKKIGKSTQAMFSSSGMLAVTSIPFEENFSSDIIKSDNSLHKYLNDQNELYMVMYCTNPKEILRVFETNREMEYLEVVMGHKKVQNFKKSLTKGVLKQLSILIDNGKLAIYTSDSIHYHTKLYICHNSEGARLINGSANFTRQGTGIRGRQWNDIWIWNITGEYMSSPIYIKELNKYNIYKSNVELFIDGDLASIFASEESNKKCDEMMENWLKTDMVHGRSGDAEVRQLTRLINKQVLREGESEVIEIMPPQSDTVVKKLAEDMSQLGIQLTGQSTIQIIRSDYLNHKLRPYPMMDVDFAKKVVLIGLGNEVIRRTASKIDVELLRNDLRRFQDFICTVELTDYSDQRLAKMSMYEAMLYILCSPFHNHYMETRRRIYGIAEERGPRILHLWGNTYNGKSKFLNVASKYLTGSKIIKPRDSEDFNKTNVESVQRMQSAYPQMFDDITNDKWTADGTEKVIKTTWDKKWRPGDLQSQLILTSNRKCPDGQMKTRVKEIHFPATFERSKECKVALLEHLEGDCDIFAWFSKLYFDYVDANPEHFEEDESYVGRIVFNQMFEMTGLEKPDWICEEPLENLYEKTAMDILGALVRKDAWFKRKSGEFQIHFSKTLEFWEIRKHYSNGIPPECNVESKGRRLFIKSQERFLSWLAKTLPFFEQKDKIPRSVKKILKSYR